MTQHPPKSLGELQAIIRDVCLPGLPIELIAAAYVAAPGDEIESGKFANPESSAALVANVFGFFLDRASDMPPFAGFTRDYWPARTLDLETIIRFPWTGGRHPCLDVLIETDTALIGIESKRYEPFRIKSAPDLSNAYWRDVWGPAMSGYTRIRDELRDTNRVFSRLDAGQLIKHALALRSAVHRTPHSGKKPVLLYLHAEPSQWPDGRAVPLADIERHRDEIHQFSKMVVEDEVSFHTCTYGDLLAAWTMSGSIEVRAHTNAVSRRFAI